MKPPSNIEGWVAAALITLPWLISPQAAPSPVVVPWLVTLACGGCLLLIRLPAREGEARPAWQPDAGALPWALILAALINSAYAMGQYWSGGAASDQVFGLLRQRNHYATLTNLGLLALIRTTQDAATPMAGKPVAWSRYLMVITLAAGNAATASRTGLLGLLLTATMCLAWQPNWKSLPPKLVAAALASYAVAGVLTHYYAPMLGSGDGILGRLSAHPGGCAGRLLLWQNVLELIAHRPWTGWGWGELDYAHFITKYEGPRECELIDNAHNLPLHLAVELGLPAAAAVCGLALGAVWAGRPWRETDPGRQLAWGVLALILAHSMVEYPLWYGPFFMTALLCVRLLVAPVRWGAGRGRYAMPTAGVLLLLAVAYAAWDYHRVIQIYLPPEQRSPSYRDHTLEKIGDTRLFSSQVQFAALSLARVSPENARQVHELALSVLHYSPEAGVVEKLIESAELLHLDEEARFYRSRYSMAYPDEYARWVTARAHSGR